MFQTIPNMIKQFVDARIRESELQWAYRFAQSRVLFAPDTNPMRKQGIA
jgi:hypothetical protein